MRHIAPELIAELGVPWDGLWELLTKAHGEREVARVLARLLGAVCEHGEQRLRRALEAAVAERRVGVLELTVSAAPVSTIAVPLALADYVVEAGRASDYARLLFTAKGAHE